MDVLRRVHRSLIPGGVLLDAHPTGRHTYAVCGGWNLGAFNEDEFLADIEAMDAGVERALAEGLFSIEREWVYAVVDRFDSPAHLLETASGWRGFRVPPALARAIRRAPAPFDVLQEIVLRRYRAL